MYIVRFLNPVPPESGWMILSRVNSAIDSPPPAAFFFSLINARNSGIGSSSPRSSLFFFFHHLKDGRKRDWKADESRAGFYSCCSLSLRRSFFMGATRRGRSGWRTLSRTDALFDLSPSRWLIGRRQLL